MNQNCIGIKNKKNKKKKFKKKIKKLFFYKKKLN